MNRLLVTALTLTITTASPMAPEQPTQQGWFSRAVNFAASAADSARRNIAASPFNPVAIFSPYVTVPLYARGKIDPALPKLSNGDFIKMSFWLELEAKMSSDLNFTTKARAWQKALSDRFNMVQLDHATQAIITTHNDAVDVLLDGQFHRMVTSQNTAAIKTIRSAVLRELAALHTLLIANSANPYKNPTVARDLPDLNTIPNYQFQDNLDNNQDNNTSSNSDNDFQSINNEEEDYQADTEEQQTDIEEAPTMTTTTTTTTAITSQALVTEQTQQNTNKQQAPLSPLQQDGNISDPMSLSSDEEQNKPNFETEDLYSGTSASETDTNVPPTAPISPQANRKSKKRAATSPSLLRRPSGAESNDNLRSKKTKTTPTPTDDVSNVIVFIPANQQ